MNAQQLTPIMFVDAIEPCLPFWVDRLGFERHAEVNDDAGTLNFVLLLRDQVQIMYQTRASAAEDITQLEPRDLNGSCCLYVNVDDLDAAEEAVRGLTLVQSRRKTFYGALEIAVREPAGNLIVFAQRL